MTRRAAALGLLLAAAASGAATPSAARAQCEPIPLWPAGAPGALGTDSADVPTITPYLPTRRARTGTAVVIFPGGGYTDLATDHEGIAPARWLRSRGVAAFVVRYRLGPRYHAPAMPNDALRAVRVVRARAAAWGIDPRRIGVMGFSAGGHMASVAGTQFDAGDPRAADSVDRVSSRPDFMLLIYPVITMRDPYAHLGSRTMLIGPSPSPEARDNWSSELHVRRDTPPAFLVATSDDHVVPVENSLFFYQALHRSGIPAELHVYESGPHGFGLARGDAVLSTWPARAEAWMRRNGWLRRAATR